MSRREVLNLNQEEGNTTQQMKALNNAKRSRLKIVIYFGTGILLIGAYSAYNGLEGSATAAIIALGGIVAKYTHDETKRPSSKNKTDLAASDEEQS